jgi:hypothetical protein
MQQLMHDQPSNKTSYNITLRVLAMFDTCGFLNGMGDEGAAAAVAALSFLVESCQVQSYT